MTKKKANVPELDNPELDNPELDSPELDNPELERRQQLLLIPDNFQAITADIVLSVMNNRLNLHNLALLYMSGEIDRKQLSDRLDLSIACVHDLYEKIQEFATVVSTVLVEAQKRWEE